MDTVFVVLFSVLFFYILFTPYKETFKDVSFYTGNIKCTDYIQKQFPDFYQTYITPKKELQDTLSDMNTAFIKNPDVGGGESYNAIGCLFSDEQFSKYALDDDCDLNKYTLTKSLDTIDTGCLYKFDSASDQFADVLQDAYNVQNDHSPNSKWVLYQNNKLRAAQNNTQNSAKNLIDATATYNNVVAQQMTKLSEQTAQNVKMDSLQKQIDAVMKLASSDEISFMHPDGRQWKFDARYNCIRLNYGVSCVFKINAVDDKFVYLQNITNNNLCVKHADYLLRHQQYYPKDTSFQWVLMKQTVNTYNIMNVFGGGYMIGYDSASDLVLIVPSNDKRIVAWKSSSVIPSKYAR